MKPWGTRILWLLCLAVIMTPILTGCVIVDFECDECKDPIKYEDLL